MSGLSIPVRLKLHDMHASGELMQPLGLLHDVALGSIKIADHIAPPPKQLKSNYTPKWELRHESFSFNFLRSVSPAKV